MNNIGVDNSEFCSGCGLCESICPVNAIKMNVENNFFRPLVNNNNCVNCGKCIAYCPGHIKHNVVVYSDFKHKYYGHSNNLFNRTEAASGGITTELLKFMLDNSLIDYVITANVYNSDCNLEYVKIDKKHSNELYNYSGSNYCPVNIGKAIKEIKDTDGKYAIVCLPCLSRGIKKLMEEDDQFKSRIKFVITLLCNHLPSYEATQYIIKKYKIKKHSVIKFRGGGWFGEFRAFDKNKASLLKSIPFTDYFITNFSKCFWQKACIGCNDHFGYEADVCMGDADFVKYRGDESNIGETMIFSNNQSLIDILQEMKKYGFIDLKNDITNEELELIYGPLSKGERANESNLKQGVSRIILEEHIDVFFKQINFLISSIINKAKRIKRNLIK